MTIRDDIYGVLSSVFPKPISQIVEESGHAYGTVQEHLARMKAKKVSRSEGPGRGARVMYLRPSLDESVFPVMINPRPEVVRGWRVVRDSVAEDVRNLSISDAADPIRLADSFIETGKLLMEIGIAIEQVKLDPDWYAKLGGRIWLSNH